MPRRLIEPKVNGDHRFQHRQHFVELVAGGVDNTGLPATVISALSWPSPGVAISSAMQDTGA